MAPIRRLSVFSAFFVLFFTTLSFSLKGVLSDTKFHSQSLTLIVSGTSTLHDWDLKSDKGHCEVLLGLDNNDKLNTISALNFSVPAESLKGGHSLMDDNTYKALKTGTNKTISFVLSNATVAQTNATTYQIKALGKLTIAGITRETDLAATGTYYPVDKSFVITGTKALKMTDFNVTPPSVMMGTIKTGDEISVYFSTKIVR
ncbi:MAG: YceI family protein [Flavisolibacter sp.]|nr:YceI family protein [Flavisolibacter sp.]